MKEIVKFEKVDARKNPPKTDCYYYTISESDWKCVAYYDFFHNVWRNGRTDDIEDVKYWYKPIK
jgi:hypothetical protein